ncbi:MAG: PQQ-binding-like beta-propeller repeat protein [Polyangiales bacterium]
MSACTRGGPVARQLLTWVLSTLAAACAGSVQEPTTRVIVAGSVCSDQPPLLRREPTPSAAGKPATRLVAYVTDGRPSALVVYDLDSGRERLRVAGMFRNRPELLDDVVVAVVGPDAAPELVGYDLETGEPRFRRPVERASWLGAVQVGDRVIYVSTSLSFRPSERGSTLTAIDARDGSSAWQHEVPYALSRPSTLGDRVLVVSDHADVWALDANSGKSAGCAPLGTESIDWLDTRSGELLLGASDARHIVLTDKTQPRDGSRLHLPFEPLPGQPSIRPSGYDAVPATRSAYGRVGVSTQLKPDPAGLQVAEQRYVYAFYRQLFAFQADGALVWARLFDTDAVRVESVDGAVVVVTEAGQVQWLDAHDGHLLGQQALIGHVASAALRLSSAQLPDGAKLATPPPERSLRDALRQLAIDTDSRLLPGRQLAVQALAASSEPEASRDLLDVYVQRAAPSELKSRIARVLAERSIGSELLLSALDTQYDFLSGSPAPPLAAIVPGLVRGRQTQAVPKLITHLFDPNTERADLRRLALAIATLGGPTGLEALGRFFVMYHADSSLGPDSSALIEIARILWTGASTHEVKLVEAAAQDPATLAELRLALVPLMAAPEPEAPVAPAVNAKVAPPKPVVPELLNDADIARTFTAHAAELRDCLGSDVATAATLRAVRFSFVIERSGTLSQLQIWPKRAALTQCLAAKLAEVRFPAFSRGRRMASYTLALRPEATTAEVPARPTDNAPFWQRAQLRGATLALPDQPPWWRDQNPLFVAVDEPTKPESTKPVEPQPAEPKSDAPSSAPPTRHAPTAPEPPTEAPSGDTWWVPAQPR